MNASVIPRSETPDMEHPGFTRMLLVDTNIFKGMIGEVPLDDNVLITGINASGKTSVIQTLLLAFGLSPQKFSRKNQDKNFFGHYLPRTTSCIAFEYRNRMGAKRAVIMHIAISEEKLIYRFVRSGLYENMFVTDDGKFVEFNNVATHLRDRNYQIASRQITTQIEYQTIIQGLPIENPRRSDLAQLQADYALAPPRTPLRNVENIIFSMLRKNGSLRALENMVAEQVLKGERHIRMGGKREDLANWPKRFRSYRDVMEKEEDVVRLVAKNTLLENADNCRKEALAEMQGLLADIKVQEQSLGETLTRQESVLRQEEEAYTVKKEEADSTLSEARVELRTASVNLNQLTDKHTKFMKDNIEEKADEFNRLPELENTARQVSERLTALKSQLGELTSRYDILKEDCRETADIALDGISRERDASESGRPVKRKAIEERRQQNRARAEKDYAPQMNAASETLKMAIAEVGAAKEATINPSVDSVVLQRLEDARKDDEVHQSKYNDALEKKIPLQAEETAAKADVEKVEKEIDRLSKFKQGFEKKLADLEISKSPSDGTLLAFLRRQRPDWGNTIGRVLREDLLNRTDLGPNDLGSNGGVFGLDLALEDVEPLEQADLSRIEISIDKCKAEIGELEQQITSAGKVRHDAEARFRDIRKKSSTLEAETGILAEKRKCADDYLKICKAAYETALENASQAAVRRLEEAEAGQTRAEAESARLQADLDNDLSEYDQRHKEEMDVLEKEIEREIQAFSEREARIRDTRDADLKTLDEERAKVLLDNNVDSETLENLETNAKAHRDDVARIRSMEKQVTEWRVFLADDWSRVDDCRAKVKNYEVTENQLSQAFDKLMANWTQKRNALKRDMEKTRKDLSALREDRTILENRLLQNADETLAVVHTTRTVDALLSALNEAERDCNTFKEEIRVGVKDVARVFRAESGSPPEQHIRQRMQAFESVSESPEWLPAFEDWFNDLHEQHRDTLRNDAHFHAEEFKNKYQILKRIDERIAKENHRLQQSLSKNISTDVVEDIQIRIESGIKELEFFPALARISDLHEKWTLSGDDLPPDVFTEALSALLEYWSGNEGITADLRQQIQLEGHVVENGIKRKFQGSTDLADISSNGVSYLILTTILVGFINIVRGEKPVQMVWALDELGNIDSKNVRNLLEMLNKNGINLISATPNADMGVRESFAHRLLIKKDKTLGPRLMEVPGAAKPSHTLAWSKERRTEIQAFPPQSVSVDGEG